jgi:hypothetical protein
VSREDKEALALMGGYFTGIIAVIVFMIIMFPPVPW